MRVLQTPAALARIPGQRRTSAPVARSRSAASSLTVFTNERLGRSAGLRWAAPDARSASAMWESYLGTAERVRVVARGRRGLPGTVDLPGGVDAYVVPCYDGTAGLVRRFVPVLLAISHAVRDADRIVLQVPGPNSSIAGVVCRLTGRRYDLQLSERLTTRAARAQLRWLVRGADAVHPFGGTCPK